MNPRDFLAVARTLLDEKQPSAACCRASIGRSYYAAFNVALGLVNELGIPLDKAKNSHDAVIEVILDSEDSDLKEICDILKARKRMRTLADYNMKDSTVENPQKAGQELVLAERLIKKIDGVRKNEIKWTTASGKMIWHARHTRKKIF
jgi:hypothetical protein